MRNDSFRLYVEDQLNGLSGVALRAMFGGWGLYVGRAFVGILFRGRFYLKTDAASRPAFVARGMRPFRPSATQTLVSYYEVPADVLEDRDALAAWVEQARRSAAAGSRRSR